MKQVLMIAASGYLIYFLLITNKSLRIKDDVNFRTLHVYDLLYGKFPLENDSKMKIPELMAYFPFHLYRGDYFQIPDFSVNTRIPFLRTFVGQDLLVPGEAASDPAPYLINADTPGWVWSHISDFHSMDIPYISKTVSVSFDVVNLGNAESSLDFEIPTFSLILRAGGGKEIYFYKNILKFSIQKGSGNIFTGSMTIQNQYRADNGNFNINGSIRYYVMEQSNSCAQRVFNSLNLFYNGEEERIKMKAVQSKLTLTHKVNLRF